MVSSSDLNGIMARMPAFTNMEIGMIAGTGAQ